MADSLIHKHLECTGYIACPKCNAEQKLLDYINSSYFSCTHCHTYFNRKQYLKSFKINDFENKPSIPLGSIGTFENNQYVLAGFIIKKEKGSNYKWREYLLINKEKGYAFLSEFDGHWNFIAGTNHYPELNLSSRFSIEATYNEINFRLFNEYVPQVLFAMGEFDWDITEDSVNTSEFIAPPLMLVNEKEGKKDDWHLATYKTPKEIASAFGINRSELPTRFGVGANQPSPVENQVRGLIMTTIWAAILMLFITIFFSYAKPEKTVFIQNYIPERDSTSWGSGNYKTIVTESFKIDGPAALNVRLRSNVSNEWMEVPITLINEQTGKFYEFTKSIEFYHGYEGGESWSEGGKEENAVLSKIPTGKYHLSIDPSSNGTGGEGLDVLVTQNTTLWSNFFISILLIGIFPAIQYLRNYYFDHTRWAYSDYSPYANDSDE